MCIYIYIYIYIYVCLCVCVWCCFNYLSSRRLPELDHGLFVHPSVRLSVRLFVCLFVCWCFFAFWPWVGPSEGRIALPQSFHGPCVAPYGAAGAFLTYVCVNRPVVLVPALFLYGFIVCLYLSLSRCFCLSRFACMIVALSLPLSLSLSPCCSLRGLGASKGGRHDSGSCFGGTRRDEAVLGVAGFMRWWGANSNN